jgi:hypothetical protein
LTCVKPGGVGKLQWAFMGRDVKRRVAILLVAILGFAQFGAAFASCLMDRAEMSAAMSAGHPCGGCDEMPAQDMAPGICASHCATGTQPAATGAVPVFKVVLLAGYTVAPPAFRLPGSLDGLPGVAPPSRILLHSFQI